MCPYYMSIGVSLEEYWHGDTENLKFYVNAHKLKNEDKNWWMWFQGLYITKATVPIKAGKNKQKIDYPKEPMRLTPETQEDKDKKALANMKRFARMLSQSAAEINKKHEVTYERIDKK